jgi:TonB-linked SusC/RagA family outer membrane protein
MKKMNAVIKQKGRAVCCLAVSMLMLFSFSPISLYALQVKKSRTAAEKTDSQFVSSKKLPSHQRDITLNADNTPLLTVLKQLAKKAEVGISYQKKDIPNKKVTIHVKDVTVYQALDTVLKGTDLQVVLPYSRDVLVIKKEELRAKIQKETVTGTVVDAQTGNTMPGVNILVKGTMTGTVTDSTGYYKIGVSSLQDTLVFSFIGYQTRTVPIDGRRSIDVSMKATIVSGKQMVVVGYGKQKKISMVGAQSSIEDIDTELKQPANNLSNLMAGKLPGIISVQRSGEPGYNGSDFWIRGISTFSSGLSKPLILVDGVPRTFENIDPEDIKSFSILKDAAATAVYGVRGANGVILIKTKTGQVGKPKIRFRYYEGVESFVKLPKFANGATYMKMSNEASVTRGGNPKYSIEDIELTKNKIDTDLYPDVNWFNELFNKFGQSRNGNLNISGGTANTQYYVGLSYYDKKGLYKQKSLQKYSSQAKFKRYNLTSNITLHATKSTKVRLGVRGFLANVGGPQTGLGTIFSDAYFNTPINFPPVYSNGQMADIASSRLQNPYAELTSTGYYDQWRTRLASNITVTQDLGFWVKGLSVRGKFAFDTYSYTSMHRKKVPDTYLAIGRDNTDSLITQLTNPGKGTEFLSYSAARHGDRKIYSEVRLNYKQSFRKNDVGGMLLYNQSDELDTQAGSLISSLPHRFRGLAGRATYGYNDTYFLEFDFGYNGSENFASQNRYGFFPSFGGGWVISNQKFFKPLQNIFQLFKLRFSYGLVGSSQISGRRFAYIGTVGSGAGGYYFGKKFDNHYSGRDIGEYPSDVTWEVAHKMDFGVDIDAINGKLNLTVDFFKQHRTGIFLQRNSLPYYMGLNSDPYGNVGIINNHGVDGSLTWNGKAGPLSFQFKGNFTWTRNKVIEDDRPDYKYPWLERKGRKVGQTFGYIALGLFKSEKEIENSPSQNGDVQPGDIRFKDINGDGKIDAYDKAPIGYGDVPEIVYGLGFRFGYKSFSLSGLFQGVGNMDIMLSGKGLIPFEEGLSSGNLLSNIKDRWTPEKPRQNVFYPRLSAGTVNDNSEPSTWWLKNGRYLRLKNIRLAYSLPKSVVQQIHLNNAYIFVEGRNVLTFSPFKLYDVELGNGRGADYPNVKTYAAGIGFRF